jgi:hypothetical protein
MLSQDKVASDAIERLIPAQLSGALRLTQSIFYEHLTFWHRNSCLLLAFCEPELQHTSQPEMVILKYVSLIISDIINSKLESILLSEQSAGGTRNTC